MILINGCSFTAQADDNDSWVKGFYDKGFVKFEYKFSDDGIVHQKTP